MTLQPDIPMWRRVSLHSIATKVGRGQQTSPDIFKTTPGLVPVVSQLYMKKWQLSYWEKFYPPLLLLSQSYWLIRPSITDSCKWPGPGSTKLNPVMSMGLLNLPDLSTSSIESKMENSM